MAAVAGREAQEGLPAGWGPRHGSPGAGSPHSKVWSHKSHKALNFHKHSARGEKNMVRARLTPPTG